MKRRLSALLALCAAAQLFPGQAATTPLVSHDDHLALPQRHQRAAGRMADPGRRVPSTPPGAQAGAALDTRTPAAHDGNQPVLAPLLSDMYGRYAAVYMRREFRVVAEPRQVTRICSSAWTMTTPLSSGSTDTTSPTASSPAPPPNPAYNVTFDRQHESSLGNSSPQPVEPTIWGPPATSSHPALARVALLGLNGGSTSSDFIQSGRPVFGRARRAPHQHLARPQQPDCAGRQCNGQQRRCPGDRAPA